MGIKNFLKKMTDSQMDISNDEDSNINKIINCPHCGSDKTFIKWIYTIYSIDRETICPNCGFIKSEPWMNIRRTSEGANIFHKKNGLIYIEIEYKNRIKELVVPLKGNYENEFEGKIEIHKKDCLSYKSDPLNKNNFIIIVKGIYDDKIAHYILVNCKYYDENFYKCNTDCIFELSEKQFNAIKIENNTDEFNSIAFDCYNQIDSNKDSIEMPEIFNNNTVENNSEILVENNVSEACKNIEISENNIDVISEHTDLFIVNDECIPCPSCQLNDTFIIYEEWEDFINKTIICPVCGYRENISNDYINRSNIDLQKFKLKYGTKHIRVEYRNGTIKDLKLESEKIADIMFIPKRKYVLLKKYSDMRIIAIIKGDNKNKKAYYLLTNCYDAGIYNGVILCEKRYFYSLNTDELEKIKSNPDIIEKIADKHYNKINLI